MSLALFVYVTYYRFGFGFCSFMPIYPDFPQ